MTIFQIISEGMETEIYRAGDRNGNDRENVLKRVGMKKQTAASKNLQLSFVLETGLEPVQAFLPTGF